MKLRTGEDDGAQEQSSRVHARQAQEEFEEELSQEGFASRLAERYGEGDHSSSSRKERTSVGRKELDSEENRAQRPSNSTAHQLGFFESLSRFFGFSQNKTSGADQNRQQPQHRLRGFDTGFEEQETEGDEEDFHDRRRGNGRFRSTHVRDDERTATPPSAPSSDNIENLNEDTKVANVDRSARENFEEDMESARKALDSEQMRARLSRGNDSGDFLSEADLVDMVRLFKKLFVSMEKTLKDKSGPQINNPSDKAWKQIEKENRPESSASNVLDSEENDELDRSTFGKDKGRLREGRDELPDVRVALASAQNLNKKRDAERRSRFIADSTDEDIFERPRLRSQVQKGSLREGAMPSREEEEDAPADMESDLLSRELPKSAPAYGSRKKLLRSDEVEPEFEGTFYDRIRKGMDLFF